MSHCTKCGTELKQDSAFCPSCGTKSGTPTGGGFESTVRKLSNTTDTTGVYDRADIESNKALAFLAYVLFFIPLLAAPKSPYARFHANQGLILLLASVLWSVVYWILSALLLAISWRLGFLTTILSLAGIVFFVLWIIGVINSLSGKAKELPVIGKVKIIK